MSEFFNIHELTGLGRLARLIQKVDGALTGSAMQLLSKTQLSRRKFLRLSLLAGSAALVAACGDDEKEPEAVATPTETPKPTATLPPTPTSTPTAVPEAEAAKTIEREVQYENLRLFIDATNIPVAYEIIDLKTSMSSTGMVYFDWKQKDAFATAKAQVEVTGQAQVPEVMIDDPTSANSIWNLMTPDAETEEHPWITKIPEDVCGPKTLDRAGVRIHCDESASAAQLHIRTRAFKAGGLLEPLMLLNENAGPGQQEIFDIFVVNSPFLSASALTPAQQEQIPLDDLNFLREKEAHITGLINIYRDRHIAENLEFIADAEKRVLTKKDAVGDLTSGDIAIIEQVIIKVKQDTILMKSLSAGELWFRFGNMIIRSFQNPEWTFGFHDGYPEHNKSLVVIHAGDGGVQAKDKFVFSYQKDGAIGIRRKNTITRDGDTNGDAQGGELLPLTSRSYPRLGDFYADPSATYQNGQYVYKAQAVGQGLRHEIIHSILLDWLPKLKARGLINQLEWFNKLTWDTNVEGEIRFPDDNEYITDLLTGLTIQQAERHLERNGDNSWYSFVFSIPPNIHNPDGAYMLTENQQQDGAAVESIT